MSFFTHDGLSFHYRAAGEGVPFFFQHGLGGDLNQPFGLFTPPNGIGLVACDCRAHGETRPLGEVEKLSFESFTEDLRALLEHLHLTRVVMGGISMGAAVALNFTLRYPKRVAGLVLSRPAWLDGPNRWNEEVYSGMAQLIREHGAQRALDIFKQNKIYLETLAQAPDAAQSLAGQFLNPRAEEAVARLEKIPKDAPYRDRSVLASLRVPVLVLANRQDPIHPFEYGEELQRWIPGAELKELTAKSRSKEKHAAEVQEYIAEFLSRHFLALG